jgi:hypothetical protein
MKVLAADVGVPANITRAGHSSAINNVHLLHNEGSALVPANAIAQFVIEHQFIIFGFHLKAFVHQDIGMQISSVTNLQVVCGNSTDGWCAYYLFYNSYSAATLVVRVGAAKNLVQQHKTGRFTQAVNDVFQTLYLSKEIRLIVGKRI